MPLFFEGKYRSTDNVLNRQAANEVSERCAADEEQAASRSDFGTMMRAIRAAYAKLTGKLADHVAFDELCESREAATLFGEEKWPLRHVTNALVEVSAKARSMDQRYYGGRFQRACRRRSQ